MGCEQTRGIVRIHLKRIDELTTTGCRDATDRIGKTGTVIRGFFDTNVNIFGVKNRSRATGCFIDCCPATVTAIDCSPRVGTAISAASGAIVLSSSEIRGARRIRRSMVVLGYSIAIVERGPTCADYLRNQTCADISAGSGTCRSRRIRRHPDTTVVGGINPSLGCAVVIGMEIDAVLVGV